MTRKILTDSFFKKSAPDVAEALLGKYLVRVIDGEEIASMIVETEAYEGLDDLASHASKGKTARTEIMFGSAGHMYIYLIYGMYHMLNIVTGPTNHPSAVLIRGVEEVRGPGRLTKKLLIGKNLNKLKAIPEHDLWFEDRGIKIHKKDIKKTPRIGISYAGPIWSKKLWRFVIGE